MEELIENTIFQSKFETVDMNNYLLVSIECQNDSIIYFKAIHKKKGKFYLICCFKDHKIPIEGNYIKQYLLLNKHPLLLKIKKIGFTNKKRLKTEKNDLKEKLFVNKFAVLKYKSIKDIESSTDEYLISEGKNCQIMNPTIRSKIIFGVALIMKILHSEKITYKNLQLKNVKIDENFEPTIDFLNKNIFINDERFLEECSLNDVFYMPPEMIINCYSYYSTKSDVYSFAFLIFRMFSNFDSIKFQSIKCESIKDYIECIFQKKRPDKPDLMPQCYYDLVCRCWNEDVNKRPTFNEIVDELLDDKYALNEFGMETNINDLHDFQKRINHYNFHNE